MRKKYARRAPAPRMLYVQYTNPAGYPPLEHSSRILADAGWRVLFLGAGAQGAGGLRFPPHPSIAVRQLSFCPAGWRQKLHYLWFCVWVLAWALRWRPSWIYASDPMACPVALLLSYLPGRRVIYHEHDSPARGSHSQSAFMRLVLWSRQALGRRAMFCVFPNQQRAECFGQSVLSNRSLITVWNCPRRDEIAASRPAHTGDQLRVLYHGSIVPDRLPRSTIEALAMLPAGVQLTVVGYETIGHRGYVCELRELAHQLGIAERMQFVDALPRYALMERCQQHDVGLAFMPTTSADVNLAHMTGASNKPFDYLACGLALLVSDLPDWRALYVEPGYGLACDPTSPASIAAVLRWFLEHPEELRAMGERGRQRIAAEWNYERQFGPVFDLLNAEVGEANVVRA